MRRSIIGLAIAAAIALAPLWAVAGDTEIAQQIAQKLEEQKKLGNLKGFSIGINVDQGSAWLKGEVSSAEQLNLVLELSRRVPGVRQIVNEISVGAPADRAAPEPAAVEPISETSSRAFRGLGNSMLSAITGPGVSSSRRTPSNENADAAAYTENRHTRSQSGSSVLVQPVSNGMPLGTGIATAAPYAPYAPAPPVAVAPQYHGGHPQMAYAPARPIGYSGMAMLAAPLALAQGMGGEAPVPAYLPGHGGGVAPLSYDHPHMPGYAWPSYAAYPNYAALTYPKQYSASAWPYIGPFYPYPQVPLGWRKVSLEWKDGWWMLDFKDK
jgi:hypothetical protein